MSLTASILIPVFVEPIFTELQTLSVQESALGMERMRFLSAVVMPLETSAEYPPRKLTPSSVATLSRVFAISTKSSGVLQALAPTSAIGVTEILLLTIGIPYSSAISLPTGTRFFASRVIFSYIFLFSVSRSESIQSSRLIPMVIVLTSSFSCSIILLVSWTSKMFIMFLRKLSVIIRQTAIAR